MARRTLSSIPGFSTEIGFCLDGMEEVREQVHEAVAGIPDEDVRRAAVSGAHAIGALVLHIGEAEWYWMQCVVSGHQLTDPDRRAPFWDVLKDPERISEQRYSAEFCLNEISKIREQTRQTLAEHNDSELDRVFSFARRGETHELTLRWNCIISSIMKHSIRARS